MRKIVAALVVSAMVTSAASAQDALAPWFDADGFYNRPGVTLSRSLNDLTTCRAEALRLKTVRSINTNVPSAMAFTSSGAYDPVVSGAATGIASIMFAIQDARYNGSIEQIEFRDCALALGYRHFRLSDRSRTRFNGEADRGFTALVTAQTPAAGERNERETERNYFAADLAASHYQNAVPQVVDSPVIQPDAVEASVEAVSAEAGVAAPGPAAPAPQPTGVIERVARGHVASHQAGMAIVVVSASQLSQSMNIPVAGDTFQFQRVTAEGGFLDLLRPTVTFGVRSHMNAAEIPP